MPILTTGAGVYAVAGGGVIITPVSASATQTSGTSSSFSVSIGGSGASHRVVIVSCYRSGPISGITVNGVSATLVKDETAGFEGRGTSMYELVTTDSGTQTIVVSSGAAINENAILVYSIAGSGGAASSTATDTGWNFGSDPVTTGTLTIPSSGAAIEAGWAFTATAPSWNTGVSSSSDLVTSSGSIHGNGNHITATGTITPSVNVSGDGWGFIAAAWGP